MAKFELDLSRGRRRGLSTQLKFGRNAINDSGTFEDVWDKGGEYPWPNDPQKYVLETTDPADMGKRIEIIGLNPQYKEVKETRQVGEITSRRYIRIYRMINRSDTDCAGNVTATGETSGVAIAQITGPANQTLMACYTVPRDKKAYLTQYFVSGAIFENLLMVRPFGQTFQVKHYGSNEGQTYLVYPEYQPKTDIVIKARATSSGGIPARGIGPEPGDT